MFLTMVCRCELQRKTKKERPKHFTRICKRSTCNSMHRINILAVKKPDRNFKFKTRYCRPTAALSSLLYLMRAIFSYTASFLLHVANLINQDFPGLLMCMRYKDIKTFMT